MPKSKLLPKTFKVTGPRFTDDKFNIQIEDHFSGGQYVLVTASQIEGRPVRFSNGQSDRGEASKF